MAAAGSRFAVTCGLLRQYMKEQQQSGAAAVTMSGLLLPSDTADPILETPEAEEDTRTMQLFPPNAGLSEASQERKKEEEEEEAQTAAPAPALTIFYGGRVLVFDDFPADKARELMLLAGSGSGGASPVDGISAAVPERPTQPAGLSDMPIPRKASLQRFLEKRKDRLAARDPYPAVKASPAGKDVSSIKSINGERVPWLGLGSTLSFS